MRTGKGMGTGYETNVKKGGRPAQGDRKTKRIMKKVKKVRERRRGEMMSMSMSMAKLIIRTFLCWVGGGVGYCWALSWR